MHEGPGHYYLLRQHVMIMLFTSLTYMIDTKTKGTMRSINPRVCTNDVVRSWHLTYLKYSNNYKYDAKSLKLVKSCCCKTVVHDSALK